MRSVCALNLAKYYTLTTKCNEININQSLLTIFYSFNRSVPSNWWTYPRNSWQRSSRTSGPKRSQRFGGRTWRDLKRIFLLICHFEIKYHLPKSGKQDFHPLILRFFLNCFTWYVTDDVIVVNIPIHKKFMLLNFRKDYS